MGAIWRIGARAWHLSRQTNRSDRFTEPGLHRIECESFVWPDLLVESPGAERARDRLRKGVGPEMATRALGRNLHLSGGALRHGGRARLELSALIHHSFSERADCSPSGEREVFRRFFLAPCPRPIARLT